jgi:hypothetical protein
MAFELTSLAVAETSTFQLKDSQDNLIEDAAGNPVTVTVYGPGSKEHARAVTARTNKQLKRLRKKGDVQLSADDVAEDGADFLTAITASFSNLSYNGEPVVTRDQIRAVYLDRRVGFIGDQVNEQVSAWENFTAGSATS